MTHMASNIQVATGLLVTPLKDEECSYLMYECIVLLINFDNTR